MRRKVKNLSKPLLPPFSHILVIYKLEDWEKINPTIGNDIMPALALKINEGDKELISMISMGGYSDNIKRSKKPHGYRTSIALVDKQGNTIYNKVGKPQTKSIAINKQIWLEYRKHNRDPNTKRTDCSAIREFLKMYPDSTNEDVCLFVENLVKGKIKEWHQLNLTEQQKILRLGKTVIVLRPVQRKQPSRTPITLKQIEQYRKKR